MTNNTTIDGVSRELLERVVQPPVDADSRYEQFQAMLTLRAALADPVPPACCTPTAEEQVLLANGDYTPQELWGGSRPTCPKCHKRLVSPSGGDAQVLAEAEAAIRVITGFEFRPDELQTVNGGELLAVYMAGRAHVTRLQAEVDILGKRVEEEVASSIANELKAEHERDALQSELTKAREDLDQESDENAALRDALENVIDWIGRSQSSSALRAIAQKALDYQPAPAAKCARCEASTVAHCDEKGCGYLGAGDGAPADYFKCMKGE